MPTGVATGSGTERPTVVLGGVGGFVKRGEEKALGGWFAGVGERKSRRAGTECLGGESEVIWGNGMGRRKSPMQARRRVQTGDSFTSSASPSLNRRRASTPALGYGRRRVKASADSSHRAVSFKV